MAIIECVLIHSCYGIGGAVMGDRLRDDDVAAVILDEVVGMGDFSLVAVQDVIEDGVLDKVTVHLHNVIEFAPAVGAGLISGLAALRHNQCRILICRCAEVVNRPLSGAGIQADDGFQKGTAFKHIVVDGIYRGRNGDIGQSRTVLERIV